MKNNAMKLITQLIYITPIQGKRFSQYDYGTIKNLDKYGAIDPPNYGVSVVTAKFALFIGNNDPLAKGLH